MRISGYRFLEALEHFTDPDAYSRIRSSIAIAQFHVSGPARERRLSELTGPLAEILFEKLSRGELLASAMSFSPSRSDFILILPQETFSLPGLLYNWGWNTLESPGFVFRNVEFFAPEDPPVLLAAKVTALTGLSPRVAINKSAPGTPVSTYSDFWHDPTYEHVRLGSREFSFSKLQSAIVEKLHLAKKRGEPWVHRNDLQDQLGFQTAHLSGLFRRQTYWRELIASDGRGHYKLRIDGS